MKKINFLLLVLALVAFASCAKSNSNMSGNHLQKSSELITELSNFNDSLN